MDSICQKKSKSGTEMPPDLLQGQREKPTVSAPSDVCSTAGWNITDKDRCLGGCAMGWTTYGWSHPQTLILKVLWVAWIRSIMCGPLLRVSFVQDDHNMRKLMSLSWDHIENNTVVSLNMECIFIMKHGSMSWLPTQQAINSFKIISLSCFSTFFYNMLNWVSIIQWEGPNNPAVVRLARP